MLFSFFFFSSRRRHTRCSRDWSSDVCSSDLVTPLTPRPARARDRATGCGERIVSQKPLKFFCQQERGVAVRLRRSLGHHRWRPVYSVTGPHGWRPAPFLLFSQDYIHYPYCLIATLLNLNQS